MLLIKFCFSHLLLSNRNLHMAMNCFSTSSSSDSYYDYYDFIADFYDFYFQCTSYNDYSLDFKD